MHHLVLDRWSRRDSPLHRRDARAKLAALLALLIAIATTPGHATLAFALYAVLLVCGIVLARLPLLALLARAAVVLPFSVAFAVASYLAGDPARAVLLVEKSYCSAAAVLVVVSTTPLPNLLRGMESLGAPRLIVLVVQFLYRYLFVISEQGQHMRLAARCRSGARGARRGAAPASASSHRSNSGAVRHSRFHAAAGALSVLFARSYQRAEGIHRAMLARGFRGHFALAAPPRLRAADYAFAALVVAISAAVRLAAAP